MVQISFDNVLVYASEGTERYKSGNKNEENFERSSLGFHEKNPILICLIFDAI